MATAEVSIRVARATQHDLKSHREHCSLDPRLLTELGCKVGQQIRILRDGRRALFTISGSSRENSPSIVRMGLTGRRRLDTETEFTGQIDTRILRSESSDSAAKRGSEFVERSAGDGRENGLIIIAPHGGDLEIHTDDQAQRVVARLTGLGAGYWLCKGYLQGGGALDAWHITSSDIHEFSFPLLGSVIGRPFQFAVAFHGFDRPEVLIGGLASESLKFDIKGAIKIALSGTGIAVWVAGPGDIFGGDDQRNIVNRLAAPSGAGIQIEQGLTVRKNHWPEIADAVAAVLEARLTIPTPVTDY